ncbi:MAG: 50S ribosomal protein L9 [Candidatus Improbicoccus devescovinae]|nr:MAG: 50S ribosomal protein L9 [Candidatus Improbicoccus devescovinae]
MKVFFLETVNSNKPGTILDVAPGFARNYLIPYKKAILATKEVINQAKSKLAARSRRNVIEEGEAKNLASMIDGQIVEVKVRIGAEGKMFGAVTTKDIVEAINEKFNITIDKKKLELEEEIHNAGRFGCVLRLFHNVTAKIYVDVN